MCVLGNAHMHSAQSLRSCYNVAYETVPVFVWLTVALSCPFKEDHLALPFSTPLSSGRSMVWCPRIVSAGSVSSSSTLQIWEASHLWGLLCPPVLWFVITILSFPQRRVRLVLIILMFHHCVHFRNPCGRTGLKGRGLLGRWGPNHAADPIVTRWLNIFLLIKYICILYMHTVG